MHYYWRLITKIQALLNPSAWINCIYINYIELQYIMIFIWHQIQNGTSGNRRYPFSKLTVDAVQRSTSTITYPQYNTVFAYVQDTYIYIIYIICILYCFISDVCMLYDLCQYMHSIRHTVFYAYRVIHKSQSLRPLIFHRSWLRSLLWGHHQGCRWTSHQDLFQGDVLGNTWGTRREAKKVPKVLRFFGDLQCAQRISCPIIVFATLFYR